jgi:perosamine synthetase
MIGYGPVVQRFERAFAGLHGVSRAVATNTGTAALHLCLLGLGIGDGDEVITPGYVCTAVLNAIRYVGATAVLADSNPETFNINCSDALSKLTHRTRAILVPHMFGNPVDLRPLTQTGIPIIEDCAQSTGAFVGSEIVGSIGHVAIFSFAATKMITTGGGGMVISRDASLIDRIIDMRDYDEKHDYRPRYNYQLNDLAAAIGLRQLERLSGFIARRQSLASRFTKSINASDVLLPRQSDGGVYYRYVVRSPRIDGLTTSLAACGIQARRPVFKPLHHYIGGDLPGCDRIHDTALSIPLYPALTDMDVESIISSQAWNT